MKPLIICIIGESGSGKTTAAEYIEKEFDIPMVKSYTDRPKRAPEEIGHTFVTPEEFDVLLRGNILALTKFGEYRYCCVKEDILPRNTYVIDEISYRYLGDNFGDVYDIWSIRLYRDEKLRRATVGDARMARDDGKFMWPPIMFDSSITNTTLTKKEFLMSIKVLVNLAISWNENSSGKYKL
jgi:guanylate kinase